MRGEPVGACLGEVVAGDVVAELPGLGDERGQALVDVRLVGLEGAARSFSETGTTAFTAPPPPLTWTVAEVTAFAPVGTQRQAYEPPETVATRSRVVPGARPSTSP